MRECVYFDGQETTTFLEHTFDKEGYCIYCGHKEPEDNGYYSSIENEDKQHSHDIFMENEESNRTNPDDE
jgi:hypothetical protein